MDLLPGPVRAWWWDGDRIRTERQSLATFVLRRVHAQLEQRGIEHFFLLFHVRSGMENVQTRSDEKFVKRFLVEEGLPFVDTRRVVEEEIAERGLDYEAFYDEGKHPSEVGTEILFEAIRRGIEGRYDGEEDEGEIVGAARVGGQR
jgi:hypothetical protein